MLLATYDVVKIEFIYLLTFSRLDNLNVNISKTLKTAQNVKYDFDRFLFLPSNGMRKFYSMALTCVCKIKITKIISSRLVVPADLPPRVRHPPLICS